MATEERQQLVAHILEVSRKIGPLGRRWRTHAWLDLELTMPQLKVLFLLHDGGKTMRQLSLPLGVTPQTVTGIMDRLVEMGLVTRGESHDDRRFVLTSLSQKGRQLVERLQATGERVMVRLLDQLTVKDLRTVDRALEAIYGASQAVALDVDHAFDRGRSE
jgi:DNA-binding MarR family transcriptional regulator